MLGALVDNDEAREVIDERLHAMGVANKQSQTAWGLLIVFGWMGGHRFYLRKKGWLMFLWFMPVGPILAGSLPGDIGFSVWGYGLLGWMVLDAFLIPGWVRRFQSEYAVAEDKVKSEYLGEVVTLPLTRAAQKYGGNLTVSQAVLETGLTFAQVEHCLMELSKTGYVGIENTDDGSLLFVFGDLPEYDKEEVQREQEMIALAMQEDRMDERLAELEDARRSSETGRAVKGGLAAGVAMFAARALMGEVFDDDE